jgi:hypothetical protein
MPAGMIQLVHKAKRKYKKRAPKTAPKTPKAPKTKKQLVKVIKKVISSQNETKQAYITTGNSLVKFNSGITAVGDLIQVLPNIAQGTGEGQRIGSQIRAQKLNIRGFVKLDINTANNNSKLSNVIVRMMVVSMKTSPSYQDALGMSPKIGSLLMKGQSTTAFEGYLQDIYAPINTQVFTVHSDRRFYLRQDNLLPIGASPPSTNLSQDVSNTVKFFNINVKCKNRLLRYDEDVGSDLLPSNFGPFLLLGYSYLDGSAPDSLDTKVGLSYDATFNYEDA